MICHDLDKGTMVNHDLAALTMIMASVPWVRTLATHFHSEPVENMAYYAMLVATTHIKRQLISGDNSYQFEKATTFIKFANRLQTPKVYFKNKLLVNIYNCN